MPRPQLRIAVLTLSPGEERQLEAGPLGDQVRELITQRKLTYPDAADEWVPFDDKTTIMQHLSAGLDTYELFSRSDTLASFRSRRDIRLFVIDPVVLLHPAKAQLAALIQEHVCSRDDKASCIVVFGPGQYVDPLFAHYRDKLSDLLDLGGQLFEYRADNPFRLRQYLRRIGPLLGNVPVSQRQSEANALLADITGGPVPTLQMPTMVSR
jgi:hypothetical protein